ncbi:MAG: hypothetical protein U0169_22785 [Polyangiaceae bacterium]
MTVGDLRRGTFRRATGGGDDLRAIPEDFAAIAARNPAARPDDPVAYALVQGGEAVARARLLSGSVAVDGRERPVVWDMDLLSKPGHRSSAAGAFLVRGMLSDLEKRGHAVASFASSPSALSLYERLSMRTVGKVPRYLFVLGSRPLLRAHLPEPVPGVASRVADVGLSWFGRLARARAEWGGDEFEIECIRRFDDEVDDLAEARPSFARAWIPFDSASLEWRAESMASAGRGRVLDRVYVRHRRSEALVGYGLLRTRTMDRIVGQPYRDVRATTLVDHFVSSLHPAANLALAAHVLAVAQREKSHVAEVVTTDVDMTRALRASAFRRVGGFSLSFFGGKTSDASVRLRDWRVTMAAGDGFMF